MQDKTALALDRPADQHRPIRHGVRDRRVQLLQHLGQGDARRRLIQPQAHGVFVVMGADQDHCVAETVVVYARHGHQKTPAQGGKGGHSSIIGWGASRRKARGNEGRLAILPVVSI
ncbi:hypothetical protein D3C81_1494460 [compost metagenome]